MHERSRLEKPTRLCAGTRSFAGGAGGRASQCAERNDRREPKVLRYAFRVAESGFDPAQVQDLYSNTVLSNILDAPLTYDLSGAAGSHRAEHGHRTAAMVGRTSPALTLQIRPGIRFQDHPGV